MPANKVFISYPSQSKGAMLELVEYLRGKGFDSIWRDDKRIRPGAFISGELQRGCYESDCCVLVLTKHTEKSAWCMQEVGAFWGAKKPIIVFCRDRKVQPPALFAGSRTARSLEEVAEALAVQPVENKPLVKRVFDHANDGHFRDYLKELAGRAKRIRLIGTGLEILGEPNFTKIILERAALGKCKLLEIYLADPWSPAVETRLIEENLGEDVPVPVGRDGIINRAERLAKQWKQYRSPRTKFEVRLFTHYPTFALLNFDDDYFVYPYACARLGNYSPVFQLDGGASDVGEVIRFLEDHYERVKQNSTSLERLESHGRVRATLDVGSLSAFALYFVPAANSALYRFGTKVLGYDVRAKKSFGSRWQPYLGDAASFGFHLTVCDALYFPTEGETRTVVNEVEFVAGDFEPFDLSDLQLKVGFPDDRSISLVPKDPTGTLEALHYEFVHRVYRRAVASNYTLGLASATRDPDTSRASLMIERYLAPYILSRFKPHFTLLTDVPKNMLGRLCSQLNELFKKEVGNASVRVDKLAVMTAVPPQVGGPVKARARPEALWVISGEEIALGRMSHKSSPSAT
jgi:hypothetical protein